MDVVAKVSILIAVLCFIIVIIYLFVVFSKKSYEEGHELGKRSNIPKPELKDIEERTEHHFDMNGKLLRVCWIEPAKEEKGNYTYPPLLLKEVQKYYPNAKYTVHDDNMSHRVTIDLNDEKNQTVYIGISLEKGAWNYRAHFGI